MSYKAIVASIVTFIVALLTVLTFVVFGERITEGEVGVVLHPSGEKELLNKGFNLVGLGDKIVVYPTRIQTVETETTVATKDNKRVTLPVTYTYKVDTANVLQIVEDLGSKDIIAVQDTFLNNRINKVVKGTAEGFTILDLVGGNSSEASRVATERSIEELEDNGFIVEDIVFGIPEVDAKTQEAVDLQTQATQANALKQLENENAKLDADKKQIEAEANAKAKITEATADAEANRIRKESLTPELIQQQMIQKWNGVLPVVGGGSDSIINLPSSFIEGEKAE